MVTRKAQIVGKPFPRVEAGSKLTGKTQYIDDMHFGPDLLYAGLVHSERPHARLVSIDASAAKAMPGVLDVMTGGDIGGRLGMFIKDRPVMAVDRVRYAGEPVAVVVAESRDAAREAAELVHVEYEDLPVAPDIAASMNPDAPLIHPDMMDYERSSIVQPIEGSNISNRVVIEKGDIESGFAEADVVLEHTYSVSRMQHVSMETHGAVAQMDEEGGIILWASAQRPFIQQRLITQALGLEPDRLRVITLSVGGGFGGKVFVSIEAIAVALAMAFPLRPVKLILDRHEEFLSTFMRPGLVARIRMGVKEDGSLTAMQAAYYWNTGASADGVVNVIESAAYAGTGPYRVANSLMESYGVYTNQQPASPMRGNAMAELHWALEQHIDRMAEAVGLDPLSFRLQNILKGGDVVFPGRVMHATGLDACIRRAADSIELSKPSGQSSSPHRVRGKGLAAMWNPVFTMDHPGSRAEVSLNAEDICLVTIGGVETGQGTITLAVQIVASELGIPQEFVTIQPVDTGQSPPEWHTLSSYLTWSMGNAVMRAAQDARRQVLAFVADAWGEPVGNLDIIDGEIVSYATERTLALQELLREGVEKGDGRRVLETFTGTGTFSPMDAAALGDEDEPVATPMLHFGTGAHAVEVEVDRETGQIEVLQVAAAFDVGHAINPDIVRAQIKGGVMQGLSAALLEEAIYRGGILQNPDFVEYDIATIKDLPRRVDPIIVEVPQDDGPYGARGIGTHVLVPAAAAIAAAVHDALNVRLDSMPMSSERVWRALTTEADRHYPDS